MARIKVIQKEDAEGRLKEIYNELEKKRGKLAEVHKIQSLKPESIVKHIDLYMEIMYSNSVLSRADREMIATVVSAANKCSYCQNHHGSALNKYWKNEERVIQLRKDFENLDLNEKELALCRFSRHLTLKPGDHENTDFTEPLKKCGFDDKAILDAVLVTAYFNFVNRIVLSLGLELEQDQGKGYKY